MQVCISGVGRFHLFDLAREIHRGGHLAHLYTGYPRFKIKHLPKAKVSTFPWLMGPYMMLGRTGLSLSRFDHRIYTTFDNWIGRNLQPCDIFHRLSGGALQAGQAARERYGATIVCDRASTHIL